MKLLIVDDDEAFRSRLSRSLSARGMDVQQAADARSALAAAQREQFEGVTLDLRMPGDSGLSIIRELRRTLPGSRIVVLTGFGSIATSAAAFKAGADDFLSKPASSEEILRALGKLPSGSPPVSLRFPSLEQVERDYLNRVLLEFRGNISRAAKALGLHRRSLQRKLSKQ